MRMFIAAAMIALSATSAFAQQHVPRYGETDKERSQSDIEAEKEADRAYQRSLGNIPDRGPSDPWGTVRTTDAPKTATAKSSKANAKAGAAHN
ncbi:hypothetical protein [Bradyrhizobium sp. ARR65]|uniref:hypothetical protein n=1 Tax=Bradyrhizobium sp. ARR65 TaxID=1040989 RepID=UPI0004676C27|nr:hypothetical protein [Bradyrhizobium sp. ARR65]